ncbi:Gfo/Idh/MocA family oxidoreductase [Vibrio sp. AND4]|uniref:Gfo/Idh/MocA family protein n=1 Tax=Vibrio sp. AND4 TaxID=314289 RepID=UPI00015F3547|nr:Gfo/Idh/MocA family oxidoreductase [Vibrio sp. AND4]EDP59722.1 oxidoreductase, NAD-binding protein [Vibrio sp. AND4]
MLNWGIAGLGNIAYRVAKDFDYISNGRLIAVASRCKEKSKKFAAEFSVDHAFGSYEDMANCSSVDAVYVSTIHPLHYPLAKLFLSQGKHVMVEKPAVVSVSQWLDLVETAKRNSCFLMEAMKFPLFPAYVKMKQYLLEGNHRVNKINACFGNHHVFDRNWHLFDKTLYGGAKYDVGCYLVWLYVDLLYSYITSDIDVNRIEATINENSDVDERTDFIFKKPAQATLQSSIIDNYPRDALITTDRSTIKIHGKWWNPKKIDVHHYNNVFSIDDSKSQGGGFQYEFIHFAECVFQGFNESPLITHKKTEIVLKLIESEKYAI